MKLDYSKSVTKDVLNELRAQFEDPDFVAPEKWLKLHAKVEFVKDHLQRVELRHGKFVIFGDEPKRMAGLPLGGEDSAPAPFEYFVAGFAMCAAAQYLWQIADLDLEVGDFSLEVTTRGKWTPITPEGSEDTPEISLAQITVHIDSPESEESIKELARLAHKHCPAHQSLVREVPVETEIVLNKRNIGGY